MHFFIFFNFACKNSDEFYLFGVVSVRTVIACITSTITVTVHLIEVGYVHAVVNQVADT